MSKGRPRILRRTLRRALTLTELLVVVLIIAALLIVAVPSFSSIMYSSEAAQAESQLLAAMRGGRDLALRSATRDDAAVLFVYAPAPGGGRLVMVPCQKVGEIYDLPNNLPAAVKREIFVPSGTIEPVQLPKGWMVRGLAPPNSIDINGNWYEGSRYGQNLRRGDWVFPETGFYNPSMAGDGRFRHSFMIRFAGGTGQVSTASGDGVLIFQPGTPDPAGFSALPAGVAAEMRSLRLGNPRRYVERVLTLQTITTVLKRSLLGVDSVDMVTVKPVSALALYDENRLAGALKARLDPTTGCMYKVRQPNVQPDFVPVTDGSGATTDNDARTTALVNQWLEGDTNLRNGIQSRQDGDEPQARIFIVDRNTGALRRVELQP